MPSITFSKDLTSCFTIFHLLIHIQQSGSVESRPLVNCEKLNRHSSNACATTPDECGHCLHGYIVDSGNPLRCIALKLLSFAANKVNGVSGQSLELPCEFNEEIQCVWERNGSNVDVDNDARYRFKGRGLDQSTSTRLCTLLIHPLRAVDVGPWQCASRATSDTDSLKSPPTLIDLTPAVTGEPELWTHVTFSDPVTLPCIFDQPVACDWKRKSRGTKEFESVSVDDAYYEYVDEAKGPKSDCSLRVKGLRKENQGVWECEGRVPDTDFAAKSKQCVLTGTHKGSGLHVYMAEEVVDGGVFRAGNMSQLECASDDAVGHLRWEIDDRLIGQSEVGPSIKLDPKAIEENGKPWVILSCHLLSPFDRKSVILKVINDKKIEVVLKKAGNHSAGSVVQLLFAVCMTAFVVVIIVVAVLIRSDDIRCPRNHRNTAQKRQSHEQTERLNLMNERDTATTSKRVGRNKAQN